MASREYQGLQVGLIVLVMLCVVLAVMTYVFYAKSDGLQDQLTAAQKTTAEAETAAQQAQLKVQRLKYMISGGNTTYAQLQQDLENLPGGENDPEMAQISTAYERDMALFGENFGQKRNYQALPDFLMSVVTAKNSNLNDEMNRGRALVADKEAIEKRETDRSKQFEQSQQAAQADLAKERTQFNGERQRITGEKDKLAEDVRQKDTQVQEIEQAMKKQVDTLHKENDKLAQAVDGLTVKLEGLTRETFDKPDAVITNVNQRLRYVYIDVGSADLLRPQMTFSVYDHGTSGLKSTVKKKGRVEVIQILDDHLALCRILEDEIGNVIVPGDVVHTPAWKPGKLQHFAIVGFIDLNKDNTADRPALETLIHTNGGVIDPEVTPNTEFLIVGERRPDKPGSTEFTVQELAEFQRMLNDAQQLGVDQLSVEKFLDYMGWKGDVRTVRIGHGGTSEEGGQAAEKSSGAAPERRAPPGRGKNGAF